MQRVRLSLRTAPKWSPRPCSNSMEFKRGLNDSMRSNRGPQWQTQVDTLHRSRLHGWPATHLRHLGQQSVGVHRGGAAPRQLGRLAQRLQTT